MNPDPQMIPMQIMPANPAFEFRFLLPLGWEKPEMPPQSPDFADPKVFLALGVFVESPTESVFVVGVRPGYTDGTVLEWLAYLAREHQWLTDGFEPYQLEVARGASCIAIQPNEQGPMKSRIVAFEDGGNLFTVTVMTSEKNWEAMLPTFTKMLGSFFLRHVSGPTVPLAPGEENAKPQAGEAPNLGVFAIADDARSLDPNHPTNARFRDSGTGFTPNTVSVDTAGKTARIACTSLNAIVPVPLGWFAMDDTRRLLIFDSPQGTQINFNRMGPANADELIDGIVKELADAYGNYQYNKTNVEGIPALIVKNISINNETLQQAYLFKPIDSGFLKVRITCAGVEQLQQSGNMLEQMLKQIEFIA